MTEQATSPLAGPRLWDMVARGYRDDIAPFFSAFARDALAMAGVRARMRVVDVASGPGELCFESARRGASADGLDFSEAMIAELRARAQRERVDVRSHVGDGMALPFQTGTFDAAFSMFGLIFFPDRARGWSELRRVLRPGGRAVVSSWVPMQRVPILGFVYGELGELLPELPFVQPRTAPLAAQDELADEMTRAGFARVEVREVHHAMNVPRIEAFWEAIERSTPPIQLAAEALGAGRWAEVRAELSASLQRRWGDGPQAVEMIANLAMGRVP
jgi:SAM-dependent methyltransferase